MFNVFIRFFVFFYFIEYVKNKTYLMIQSVFKFKIAFKVKERYCYFFLKLVIIFLLEYDYTLKVNR